MKFKEVYLKYNKTYFEIKSLSKEITEKIKPENITDAVIIQNIKNRTSLMIFNTEDTFSKIRNLSEKYKINISKLSKLMDKYEKLEVKLKEFENKFSKMGITHLFFEPLSIRGSAKKFPDGITISIKGKILKVYENDWEREVKLLTKKVNLLEK